MFIFFFQRPLMSVRVAGTFVYENKKLVEPIKNINDFKLTKFWNFQTNNKVYNVEIHYYCLQNSALYNLFLHFSVSKDIIQ